MMRREFLYIETKEDWLPEYKDYIRNLDKEEHEDLFEFTMANLNTTDENYK